MVETHGLLENQYAERTFSQVGEKPHQTSKLNRQRKRGSLMSPSSGAWKIWCWVLRPGQENNRRRSFECLSNQIGRQIECKHPVLSSSKSRISHIDEDNGNASSQHNVCKLMLYIKMGWRVQQSVRQCWGVGCKMVHGWLWVKIIIK